MAKRIWKFDTSKNSPQKGLFLKENLPLFMFSVSIFEMLIIELKLFDSVLTFLWFRTSIFSFRSVRLLRLSWFWRSLVWPFSNIRSASNLKLLSPELHFIQSYQMFFINLFRYSKLFSRPLESYYHEQVIFKASSGQFLATAFRAIFKISQNGEKVFWNKMWMGSFLFWIW